MTDVETRTPQKTPKKRKSIEGKQESLKKPKLENGKTPQKVQTPKQQKNQNKKIQNSVQKSKKAKQNSEAEGKKVAPFEGTTQIQSPKPTKTTPKSEKAGNKAPATTNSEKKPSIERKPRRKLMSMIKDQLKSDDAVAKAEVIKNLDTKLKAIQSRPDLTKTALRKIKLLRRLKNIAEGKTSAEGKPPGTKAKSDLSVSAKRRDRKKRAAIKSEGGEKNVPAANKKGQQGKGKNEKKATKPVVKKEEPEEESEDEESGAEEESESEAEEVVEGESGEDSGEEEEDSGEEEEDSGEEEGASDEEDDSDEEVSIPQPPAKGPEQNKEPRKLTTNELVPSAGTAQIQSLKPLEPTPKNGQQDIGENEKESTEQKLKKGKPEEKSGDEEESEDEESGDEEESQDKESGEEEEESGEGETDIEHEKRDSKEEEENSEKEEGDSDDEDDSSEEAPPKKKEPKGPQTAKPVDLDALKKSELVSKNQSRYVVFVGNIPYDTTTGDLKEHFGSCGQIKHVRIPTEKKTNKPRGFAYVEAVDEETYQKCLSKHHSHMKGRRINVLYTQGGKKKGDDRKKEIKVKNFKLGALRQQGKLLGSTKDSQKRSFRRNKQKMNQKAQES